ncbi:MAG: ATP-dependent Clp protease proteolytic subunit [bacterium]|nr:ATP-dependent Clp protease proteolytic subunit [bacterium]
MMNRDNGYCEVLVNKFTEECAKQFREEFLFEAEKSREKPVITLIDTYGGAIDGLATMVETMESVPNQVITVCVGKVISAGAILLSFGDKRFCGPHSRIMIHECLYGPPTANIHEVVELSKEALRMNEYWLGKLAENCKIKGGYLGLKRLLKNSNDDRTIHLNAAEALKFGIVDYIGIPKITSETTYAINVVTKNSKKPQ